MPFLELLNGSSGELLIEVSRSGGFSLIGVPNASQVTSNGSGIIEPSFSSLVTRNRH